MSHFGICYKERLMMALKVLGKTVTFFHFRHVKMTVGSCESICHSQLNVQTSSMLEC